MSAEHGGDVSHTPTEERMPRLRPAVPPAGRRDDPATAGTAEAGSATAVTAEPTGAGAAEDAPGSPAVPAAEAAAEGTGDDGRWADFSPPAEAGPGRPQRVRRRIGRVAGHEWTIATLGSVALAAAMMWPSVAHPATTIPEDIYDPSLQAWEVAWAGHALLTDPANLWNGNTFYPEPLSYAFTDSLLGYAPLGMIGSGVTAALVRYNVLFVLLHALAFLGGYALLRQLGARRPAAVVAGIAVAYAPWRLGQAGHLHVISTGGIMLALAMLARGHGFSLRTGYRPERTRLGWVIAGWAVAAWQLTIGFGIGLPFAYVLLVIGLAAVVGWFVRGRPRVPRRILFGDIFGGIGFAAVGGLMSLPYLEVVRQHPYARRTEADVASFSPPLRGFFIAPPQSRLWGSAHEAARATLTAGPEMALLVGYVLLGLAAAGLLFSTWRLSTRIWLAVALLVTGWLALGTNSAAGGRYGYLLLYRHVPGWDAIRTPGRLVIWLTLLLAILAAGAVSAFGDRVYELVRERPVGDAGIPLRLAMVVPVVLILFESLNVMPHPAFPAEPAALRRARGPLLVLPADPMSDDQTMVWSTDGFPKMVNGGSGFTPKKQDEIRQFSQAFPDPATVAYLRDLGIRTVVVLKRQVAGTPWARAATAAPDGVARRDVGDAVVFTLG